MDNKILSALLLIIAAPATAHVTLAPSGAAPGTRYIAHFHVGHGCSGSPTTMLQVEIPPGVTALAPETPPGWSLAMVRESGRVTAVTWKGGILPADKQGEFIIAMNLPTVSGTLVFPAIQTCEKGAVQWKDLPAAAGVPRPANPAPVLTVSPTPAQNPMPDMPAGMKM